MTEELKKGLGSDFEVISVVHQGVNLKNIIKKENPVFIILDMGMPELYGLGTLLQIRQWTTLPTKLLTTWKTEPGQFKGIDFRKGEYSNKPYEQYLTNPFDMEKLKRNIKESLRWPPDTLPTANLKI